MLQTSSSFHLIGSELLDKTAPMAGKSWQPSHGKGTCHNDIIYTVETREGRGENNPETMLDGTNSATMNTKDAGACGQQKAVDGTG